MIDFTDTERRHVIRAIRDAMEREAKFFLGEPYTSLKSALAKLEGRPAEQPKPLPASQPCDAQAERGAAP